MADLKTLLGDKYTKGMSIEDLMALEIEEPKVDMSKFVSKELFIFQKIIDKIKNRYYIMAIKNHNHP